MTIEIPLGWRRLRDGEIPIAGDKYRYRGEWDVFGKAEEGKSPQFDSLKPYIRPFDDQWHEHDGGEMPVNAEEVVDYEMREYGFRHGIATNLRWRNGCGEGVIEADIVGYRRHQPAERPATLAEPHMTETTMETPILGTFETGKKVEYTISHDTVFQVENFDGVVKINGDDVCDAEHIPALIKALEMLQ